MVSSLLIALVVIVLVGAAASAYLWQVQRRRIERSAGLKIIAGMRWREFSRLVVDAMRERGFEPDPEKNLGERGQQADITLRREGQPWLLACKQGADYLITPEAVSKLGNAVHFHQAAGGSMATPGRVTGEARSQAGAIELIDGAALWPMLKPLLPASVRDTVTADARALSVRQVTGAWVAALVVGAAAAWLLPASVEHADAVSGTASDAARLGKPIIESAAPVAAAPLTEEEQREQIRREVSGLGNIERAVWATRSTLVVYLNTDTGQDPLRPICAIVERYDALRATRLQLQPPPGSQSPVRFLQCRLY